MCFCMLSVSIVLVKLQAKFFALHYFLKLFANKLYLQHGPCLFLGSHYSKCIQMNLSLMQQILIIVNGSLININLHLYEE